MLLGIMTDARAGARGAAFSGRDGSEGMAEEDRKQLTLRIPQEVHRKVRLLAALKDQTMTELFIDLVEREYEKNAKDTGPVQLKLPT